MSSQISWTERCLLLALTRVRCLARMAMTPVRVRSMVTAMKMRESVMARNSRSYGQVQSSSGEPIEFGT